MYSMVTNFIKTSYTVGLSMKNITGFKIYQEFFFSLTISTDPQLIWRHEWNMCKLF